MLLVMVAVVVVMVVVVAAAAAVAVVVRGVVVISMAGVLAVWLSITSIGGYQAWQDWVSEGV